MPAAPIVIVDRDDNRFTASQCPMPGIDAVVYRIENGFLIYMQPDGTYRSAAGQTYRVADLN